MIGEYVSIFAEWLCICDIKEHPNSQIMRRVLQFLLRNLDLLRIFVCKHTKKCTWTSKVSVYKDLGFPFDIILISNAVQNTVLIFFFSLVFCLF